MFEGGKNPNPRPGHITQRDLISTVLNMVCTIVFISVQVKSKYLKGRFSVQVNFRRSNPTPSRISYAICAFELQN